MEEPLNFDYQALADEQEREQREHNWRGQRQTAFLWIVVLLAFVGLMALADSLIPKINLVI